MSHATDPPTRSDEPPRRSRGPASAGWALSAPLVVAAIATLAAGWLFKAHCVLDGAWQGGEQYTVGCYTDVVPFWLGRGVAEGLLPYLQTPLEYPVLAGAQIWFAGALARAVGGDAVAFLAWVSVWNAALALAVLAVLAWMGVPGRRLWWWALAPPLVLYVGHNWDLLPLLAVVCAVAAHRRGWPWLAGAAVGLGAAAKLFPALLLPLLALHHLRARRIVDVGRVVGGAAVAWLAVNLPVAAVAPEAWAQFYTFSSERSGTFAALWTVAEELGVLATSVAERNLWATIAFAVGAVAIVAAGWRGRRGHEWMLLTPLLAWFLLTNKVYSPQFDLWLVPLVILTARRLWPLAAFFVADGLVYWAEFWYLAERADFTPSGPYPALAAAALLRAAVLLVLIVQGVRGPLPAWIGGDAAAAPRRQPDPSASGDGGASAVDRSGSDDGDDAVVGADNR